MKRLFYSVTIAFLFSAKIFAQSQGASAEPVGQVIKGFTMPQLDPQGNLTCNIIGDEARVVSVNRTQIVNMRIDLYDGPDISTTITSPQCDLWKGIDKLRTRSTVKINRPSMVITAQTMDWNYVEKRGVLRENVKVVLTNFNLGKPQTPAGATAANAPSRTTASNSPAPAIVTPVTSSTATLPDMPTSSAEPSSVPVSSQPQNTDLELPSSTPNSP